jgi:FlaA1/EpsC-like NDP-sugar epimerase
MIKLQKYLISAYGTRLMILGMDVVLTLFSFIAAVALRFNFDIPGQVFDHMYFTLMLVATVRIVYFKIFRTYSGIIRFTSEEDLLRVFIASFLGTVTLLLLTLADQWFQPVFLDVFFLSNSVWLIDGLLLSVLLISLRVLMRAVNIYVRRERSVASKAPVVIFGAGQCGHITQKTLHADNDIHMQVVAFFDDNQFVHGKVMHGIRVYDTQEAEFARIIQKHGVKHAVIAIQKITQDRKKELADLCLKYNVVPMMVPPVENWLHNRLHARDIRKLKIEDLLERPVIQLDKKNISRELNGKVVMVTGAAGSIGSELARQISSFGPSILVLVDHAESPLVDIELELLQNFPADRLKPFVGDIRDREAMAQLFYAFRPDVVFHAAAYKHVPAMERQPHEAVKVNVLGTRNIADLSVEFGVHKFVMVSTDKAVNPTNVMGASKRIAEIYTQSLNDYSENQGTLFITTRFGNVLGSNGSVVPLFRKQIEAGKPVTVTDANITRFFMTIPEACQLVLEAGAMGNGGEIFLFDMGKAVKVVDIAEKMIKLYGLCPYVDIPIHFTGLRPGEKLYEELLATEEGTLKTHHPKIMIAKVRQTPYMEVAEHIAYLARLTEQDDDMHLVSAMKELVPEFMSKCSKYEILDQGQLSENPAFK